MLVEGFCGECRRVGLGDEDMEERCAKRKDLSFQGSEREDRDKKERKRIL